MPLVGIYGGLGRGKTLALAYMCWNNLFIKNRKIYANFTLYGIPFTRITTLEGLMSIIPLETTEKDILEGKEVFFAGDELWRWLSSRCIGQGARKRKELINRVLLASRKAEVTIVYTVQTPKQIDTWIRDVTDMWILPFLDTDAGILRLFWLDYPVIKPTMRDLMIHSKGKPTVVKATPFYAIYSTHERIPMIDEGKDDLVERVIPISRNPSWRKYWLIDKGVSEEKFLKICEKIEKTYWLYRELPKDRA